MLEGMSLVLLLHAPLGVNSPTWLGYFLVGDIFVVLLLNLLRKFFLLIRMKPFKDLDPI